MTEKYERNTFTLFKVDVPCSGDPMRKKYVAEGKIKIIRSPINDRMFGIDFPAQLWTKTITSKLLPSAV